MAETLDSLGCLASEPRRLPQPPHPRPIISSVPFVLAPRIVVTPESKTLDDGVATLWAAVQLSTQLRRPGGHDQAQYEIGSRSLPAGNQVYYQDESPQPGVYSFPSMPLRGQI